VIRSHHRLNRVFLNATHFLKERARAIAALRRTQRPPSRRAAGRTAASENRYS
jgi:hypothetical protein